MQQRCGGSSYLLLSKINCVFIQLNILFLYPVSQQVKNKFLNYFFDRIMSDLLFSKKVLGLLDLI